MNNRINLFDGKNFDLWKSRDGSPVNWKIEGDVATVVKKDIVSTVEFGDALIHVEFCLPDMPDAVGQAKANSGVYVHGCYEVQVLDSSMKEVPLSDDCGAIYKMYPPMKNACKKALEWQTYDIEVRAPKINKKGVINQFGSMTVRLNGVLIHDNVTLKRATPGGITATPVTCGPLMLQDHNNPMQFRNVWIEPLAEPDEKRVARKFFNRLFVRI